MNWFAHPVSATTRFRQRFVLKSATYLAVVAFSSCFSSLTLADDAFFEFPDEGGVSIDADENPAVGLIQFEGENLQAPVAPPGDAVPDGNAPTDPTQKHDESLASDPRLSKLFGEVQQVDELPADRRSLAESPAADAVFSAEATGRRTSDIGSLLQSSKAAHGISIQNRTPLVNDTRIRGQRVGQVLASGFLLGSRANGLGHHGQ
jgi:hypothetical protein